MSDQTPLEKNMIPILIGAALQAGGKIMEIYQTDFDTEIKGDGSPVTVADEAAEKIILAELSQHFPHIPVVAEESAAAGNIPQVGDRFFLVDPLDGTKEFVKRNGEFTVNIALIEHGVPTVGIVFVPVSNRLFVGQPGRAVECAIEAGNIAPKSALTVAAPKETYDIIGSRSHKGEGLEILLEHLPVGELKSAGSSLKFCLIAAGEADLYPRFSPTMEWDTAAGHAVLSAAGGMVTFLDGRPLTYGKVDKGFYNPYFIAAGSEPALAACVDAYTHVPQALKIC